MTYLHSWYPNRRPNTGQHDVAGQLANDVSYCPACLHIVELVAVKSKVLLPVILSTTVD
jgi:hypothetical protein